MKKIINIYVVVFITILSLPAQVTNHSINNGTYYNLQHANENPTEVTVLHLSHQRLNTDSIDLSVFVNLERLIMTYDSLYILPKGLPKLRKLKVLDISANNFTLLPEELALIPNLEELYLNNEPFLDFDQSFTVINKMINLKSLHLDNIPHFVFPKYLQLNKSIEYLSMRFNELHHIPDQLWKFRNLKTLDLAGNHVITVPKTFLMNNEMKTSSVDTPPRFDFRKINLLVSPSINLPELVIVNYSFNHSQPSNSGVSRNSIKSIELQKTKRMSPMNFTNLAKINRRKWVLNHVKLSSELLPTPSNNFTTEGFGIRIGW